MLRKIMNLKNILRSISFALLLLFLCSISYAGFEINMPLENEVTVDSTGFIYYSQEYNISYCGPGETLTVNTGDENLPMLWSWEWCDDFLGVCHIPGWPATFDVEEGDEINISYSVVMDTTAGSFSFYFKYTAPSIIDSIRCDFDFTATNTAVDENLYSAEFITSYPNPFNGSTRIAYDLKSIQQEDIQISIFNIKGELIKTLDGSNQDNEVIWDGDDSSGNEVNNGIYFYRITTKNGNYTNKLIKLK